MILVVGAIVFAVARSNGPASGSGGSIDDQYVTRAVANSDISLGTWGRATILRGTTCVPAPGPTPREPP